MNLLNFALRGQGLVARRLGEVRKIAANLLFGVMMVGDDRCVDATWVMGKRTYALLLAWH